MSIGNPGIHYAKNIERQRRIRAPLVKRLPWKSISIYALAFFIPVIIMTVVYICIGIYPFGDKSLLTVDLYHQYIDFLSYFRQSMLTLSPQNMLYSFSKALGGNMIGLYAYYLASPINIILLFFKPEALSEAILVITLIKIGLCGVTFTVMCRKIFDQRNWFTLIFSSCYALMAYNIVFQQNIMWLDGVIWLPIMVLGIYNIITRNRFAIYSISLAVALLSNYYIGYMLCIFSVMIFIYMMLIIPAKTLSAKQIWQKIGRFVLGSALAGGLAAIILIPTFVSLQNGKAALDPSLFNLNQNFEFTQLLQKLFIGEMNVELLHQGLETTLPDIFSGTVTTILCLLYFFNKKITIKEKAASIVMVLLLLMSFHIKAFDLIWHGLNTPVGFLYRNAFIFSFFAIFLGVRCFINIDGVTKTNILSSLGIFVAIAILVNNFSLETLTSFEIYLTIIFFMVYSLILSIIISGKKSVLVFVSLMMIVAVEFEISGFLTLEDLSHVSRQTYVDNVTDMSKALARLQKIDEGNYRIDKTFMRSRNDGMMHGYPTITHSSSTADYKVVQLLNKMGYRNESNIGNSYDYGSTLPADSLMGIKYIMSDSNDSFLYYPNSGSSDEIKMYKNPYALPLMFRANKEVLGVQDSYNVFELQNSLYNSMTGGKEVLSQIQNVQTTLENLTKTTSGKNVNYYKNNEDEPAYINYTFTAINSEEIYAHFPTEPIGGSTVDVYVNGVKIREHLDSDHLTYYDVVRLGNFKAGETIKLRLSLQENETNFENAFIYALNPRNFEAAYNSLSSNPINYEIIAQNHIKATVENMSDNQLIFTTIPYDKGWSVYIDGNKIDPAVVLDTLMAINVPNGSHQLEMKYTPPGLNTGIIVSGASIVLFAGAVIIFNGKRKRKKTRSI